LTETAQQCRFELVIYSGDRQNKFAFQTKFGGIKEPKFSYDQVEISDIRRSKEIAKKRNCQAVPFIYFLYRRGSMNCICKGTLRKHFSWVSVAIFLSLSFIFVGCGGGGTAGNNNTSNATLTSISVTPTNPSIAKGTSQQFTATGTYSDNTTKDMTTSVNWSSSTSSVATISNAGLAIGAGTGSTSIEAKDPTSGISGSTTLTVNPVWQSFKSISGKGIYSDQLVIDYADENKIYSSEWLGNSGAAIANYNNNSIVSFLPKTSMAVDPNNNNHILALSPFYIYESIDGGNSWNTISNDNTFGYEDTQISPNINYLQYSPDGKVVYCYSQRAGTIIGSPGWLFASSVDNGRTWRAPTGLRKGVGVGPIAVSNSKPNIVFARNNSDDMLYKSTDYGLNWTVVSSLASSSIINGDLAVDPFDENVVYTVTYASDGAMKFQKSIDGGATWKQISFPNYNNYRNYAINVNQYVKGLIYIGVESESCNPIKASILRSTDGGETWAPLNNSPNTGLPTDANGNFLGGSIASLVSGSKKSDGTVTTYTSFDSDGPYKYIDSP
jgi:hypothetical protein